MSSEGKLRLAVFDWAGTTVDMAHRRLCGFLNRFFRKRESI